MNKEEILAKSRAENKNMDFYEQEVIKQASKNAVLVMALLGAVFFAAQIFLGEGTNWGIWAVIFSANMTLFWGKYMKLHRRHEFIMAMIYTAFVLFFSGFHIYHLIASSTIL